MAEKKGRGTKSPGETPQGRMNVLLEQINSKMDAFAEGQSSMREEFSRKLDEKIDGLRDDLGGKISNLEILGKRHSAILSEHSIQLAGIEVRLGGVEGRLGGVEGRLSGVEGRLSGVEGRLSGVENRLDGVENRLGGVENRLDGVENRLGGVEATLQEHSLELKEIKHEVRAQRTDLNDVRDRVTVLENARS